MTKEIFPWKITCDYEATRQAYSQIEIGDPERCGCEHCLNFAAVRDKIYPTEVRALFDQIGIDYRKESEVYHLYKIRPGWHFYGGWIHFIGSIEYVDESYKLSEENPGIFNYIKVNENFSWFFVDYKISPHNAAFGEQPLVEIDFTAKVPWVLEAKEPE